MIKKCNFKYKPEYEDKIIYCTLARKPIYQLRDTHHMDCSGEENCIIFQIYKQLHPKKFKVTVGDFNEEYKDDFERFGPAKIDVTIGTIKSRHKCTVCGTTKGNFSFSSGYCDDCYMKNQCSDNELEADSFHLFHRRKKK
jgi:hypothetical protein